MGVSGGFREVSLGWFSGWMDLTAETLVAAVGAVGIAVAALIGCHTLARVATCR